MYFKNHNIGPEVKLTSVLPPLRVPGGEGLSIDVDDRLLSQVDPEDVLLLAVLLQDRIQDPVEAVDGGLARSEDRKSGHLQAQASGVHFIGLHFGQKSGKNDHSPFRTKKISAKHFLDKYLSLICGQMFITKLQKKWAKIT
jgi:hypothetical protein